MDRTLTSHDRLAFHVDEAAIAVGIGRTVFYGLIRSGEIKALKVGKRTIVTRKELERWLDAQPVAAPVHGSFPHPWRSAGV